MLWLFMAGTVNASLLGLIVMDATALTASIILRMMVSGVKLLMLPWSVIRMHLGLRLGAARMQVKTMYVFRPKSLLNLCH
jgi:hypothetical protein